MTSRTAYEPPLPVPEQQSSVVVNSKLSVDTPHIQSSRGAQLHCPHDDACGGQLVIDEETPSTATGSSVMHRELSFIQGDLGPPLDESPLLRRVLNQVFEWSAFDVFELHEASGGRPLYALAMAVFTEEGLLDGWKIDKATFDLYLRAVQQGYRGENPYHNSIHAADVTQAVAVMLRAAQSQGWRFTLLEKFALLFAAVVHDLAHPGLTNEFLANTSHTTALMYNDRSINENYHVSCAFRLAHEQPFNIFQHFSKEEYKAMRRMVIGSVLMTDMTQHFQLLEAFNRARSKQPDINLWDEKDILLQLILHTADISNPFRVPRLATLWGELVTQEFIQQGDKERALGMQVTPTCDKDIVVVSTSQLRFAKWFVKPLMEEFKYVSREFSQLAMELLGDTEQYWIKHELLWKEGHVHPQKRALPSR